MARHFLNPDYPVRLSATGIFAGSMSAVEFGLAGKGVRLFEPTLNGVPCRYGDHNGWGSYSQAQDNGGGNYLFTGSACPNDNYYRLYVAPSATSSLGSYVYQIQLGEFYVGSLDLENYFFNDYDNSVSGNNTFVGNNTFYKASLDASQSIIPSNRDYITRVWATGEFASSASVSSLTGAYLPISGGQINGNVTANMSALTLVQTNVNGFAASANLKKVSSSSMHIYNNLGTFPTGEHFTYGFFNTDQEHVPVFSMGCDDGEIPYIDFKNRQILNFNGTISMAGYMPLTGGVFSGSVTANGPRLILGNTQFGSKSTTGDFAKITTSGATANARGFHVKSSLGVIGSGDLFSIFYTDTNPDNHYPIAIGADPSTELPYIKLSSELFKDEAPDSGGDIGELSAEVYGDGSMTLTEPTKWLEFKDNTGVIYKIPAYLKTP